MLRGTARDLDQYDLFFSMPSCMTARRKFPGKAIMARMAFCLAVGAIVFCTTFAAIGFVEKFSYGGATEALAWLVRVITHVTMMDLVRLTGLSAALSLIACFPVYFSPAQASAGPGSMVLYAAFAALALAGYLSFESWYWFGDREFPPPGFIVAHAVVGLASAYASRAVLTSIQGRSALHGRT
jgi:hypothetical protein